MGIHGRRQRARMAGEALGEVEVLRGAIDVRDGRVAQAVEGIEGLFSGTSRGRPGGCDSMEGATMAPKTNDPLVALRELEVVARRLEVSEEERGGWLSAAGSYSSEFLRLNRTGPAYTKPGAVPLRTSTPTAEPGSFDQALAEFNDLVIPRRGRGGEQHGPVDDRDGRLSTRGVGHASERRDAGNPGRGRSRAGKTAPRGSRPVRHLPNGRDSPSRAQVASYRR